MKYYLIRIGIILKKILPNFLAYLIAITLGYLAYVILAQRRKILTQNIKHLVGSNKLIGTRHGVSLLVKETFVNFALDYMNFLAIPSMSITQIKGIGKAQGTSNLDKALSLKRGVILVSAHIGAWDLAGCFLTAVGYPTITIAESKGPGEKMFKLYSRLRGKTGMEVIRLEDRDVTNRVIEKLKQNKILTLLGDRDLTGKGVKVKFLGSEYLLPKGPALLSLRYEIPIVTGYFLKKRKWYTGVIEPQIDFVRSGNLKEDIKCLTQLIAERLEIGIKTYPTQWYVFQMNW
ncbi:MAG: hypothetical protein QMD71_06035 [bacterium]|nr:hypothetical protein [bacterium]